MRLNVPALALCLAASLTGCAETPATQAITTIAPTEQDRTTPAYKACMAALVKTTGHPATDISVFDYLYSEAGTQIQATLAGAEAPWRCLASNDGVVESVMYTGSEGAL